MVGFYLAVTNSDEESLRSWTWRAETEAAGRCHFPMADLTRDFYSHPLLAHEAKLSQRASHPAHAVCMKCAVFQLLGLIWDSMLRKVPQGKHV